VRADPSDAAPSPVPPPTPLEAPEPTPDGSGAAKGSGLTEAERAAAFTSGRAPVDRTASLRAGTTPIPRKFFVWVAIGFAVLGLGGIVGEKVIGTGGISALTSEPTTTLAGTANTFPRAPSEPNTPVPPGAPPVDATPTAVTGTVQLAVRPAPSISLQDQTGRTWTLADARGKVVVLTFFNAECDDICPVLAREITEADQLMGPQSSRVEFVVVNSDPLETSLTPVPPALTQGGLGAHSNLVFLNGPVTSLSPVWKRYAITVAVNPTIRVVDHTDSMYFIDPRGRLRLEATPFANENNLGIYSLDSPTMHTFAEGVAASASHLLPRTS
jgi:cytochrome oxidase Cu insertion factor (SCO1/SenC/PrrC family)